MANRWNDLDKKSQQQIETRLLKGSPKLVGETEEAHEKWGAWSSVNRIQWLANNGCKFTFNLDEETRKLRSIATDWKTEYANKAAETMEGRSGWVQTKTEDSDLLDLPLDQVLSKANEMRGLKGEVLTRYDPFLGLSSKHPVRAYLALINGVKRDEYPEWAWRTFLNSETHRTDKVKFAALIGERISVIPDEAVAKFLYPVSDWLQNVSTQLSSECPPTFDKVMSKLINVVRKEPSECGSGIIRGNKEPDWAGEAINAPVGKLAEALMNDPRKNDLEKGAGFPVDWLLSVEELLGLPEDLHRHALVMFAFNLNWFYFIDPDWTEANLLSVLENGIQDDQDAIWSGFLWRAKTPQPKLYTRLKNNLLALAKLHNEEKYIYIEILASMILKGWGSANEETGKRFISNSELRDVLLNSDDEFRSRILWTLERWCKDDGKDNDWAVRHLELLRDVWPRQKTVKSSRMSERICDMAFSKVEHFPEVAEVVLPLLAKIDNNHIRLSNLRKSENNIADLYPEQALSLLHAVLPDNVDAWPYDVNSTLVRIAEADRSLRQDERLLELNRKWNAR